MTQEKAVEKIMAELALGDELKGYVERRVAHWMGGYQDVDIMTCRTFVRELRKELAGR